MKKFEVTLYFHTSVSVEVEAETEQEAIKKAEINADEESLLANLQKDGAPDVEEIH